MIELGHSPVTGRLRLVRGDDFYQVIRRKDALDWPPGVVVRIEVGGLVWEATAVGPELRWFVQSDAVESACAAKPRTFRMTYDDDAGVDLTWVTGQVVII